MPLFLLIMLDVTIAFGCDWLARYFRFGHYSSHYLNLITLPALLVVVFSFLCDVYSPWREWLQRTLQALMSNKVILGTGLAIMVVGLVMSRSRMGNTAFFSSLMITGFLYVIGRKKLSRGMVLLFVSLQVIDMAIVSQWFGLEQVVERIEQTPMERESRPDVSGVTLAAIADYGLTGSPVAAHFIPRYRLMVGMGFSSVMGIVAIVIHSSVDFNLQIPANAAYFVMMVALGVLARYLPTPVGSSGCSGRADRKSYSEGFS